MIRINIMDPAFNRAYWNAFRTLPVRETESPRQYGRRWREAFNCRVDPASSNESLHYIFDRDEDYAWFMLKWS